MSDNSQAWKVAAVLAAAGLGVILLWRARGAIAGAVTGDNPITRSATDAAGRPVTAYQGAGVVGTAGAAVNAASGGVLASLGDWIGGKVYDLLHDDQPEPARSTEAARVRYEAGGAAAGTGAGSFSELAGGGGGYLWPVEP